MMSLQAVPGIVETSPGVRSCMIEYDQRVLPLSKLLSILEATEKALPSVRAPFATPFCMMQGLLHAAALSMSPVFSSLCQTCSSAHLCQCLPCRGTFLPSVHWFPKIDRRR